MRRVWLVAERIEKKDVQAMKHRHRFLRDLAVVGQVGRVAETVSENFCLAVKNRDRLKLLAEEF